MQKRNKDFIYGTKPNKRPNSVFVDEIITVNNGDGETGYQYLGETKRGTTIRHGMGKCLWLKEDKISLYEGWWKDDA